MFSMFEGATQPISCVENVPSASLPARDINRRTPANSGLRSRPYKLSALYFPQPAEDERIRCVSRLGVTI